MDISLLIEKNPWWKGKGYFKEDYDYSKWKEKKIKWVPHLINEIPLKPFSLNFLFGPRQVGKTTALKLLIRKLLKSKKEMAIFYFRCDAIANYKELEEVLMTYLNFREKEKIKSSVILLDEITFTKEWHRTIKDLIDDGVFKNDVLIITGSSSLFIKKEVDMFPGRRGYGKDFSLFPLTFKEFVNVTNKELSKNIAKHGSHVFLNELNKMLFDYFNCGGFPIAINSYFEKRDLQEVKDIYLTWIKNDLAKVEKNEYVAKEIIKAVLTKMPSAISWESISKETSIKAAKTVYSYITTLKELFVLGISYFIEPNNALINFGKNKKIFFTDPLFFHMFEDWCLVKIKEKESIMAESLLASHLSRKYGDVYYWKNKEEIDCVVKTENGLKGYECKWKENPKEKKLIIGKIKDVLTITKKDVNEKMIPLSLFLYSL